MVLVRMPYLNWKSGSVQVAVQTHSKLKTQLEIRLARGEWDMLAQELGGIFGAAGGELRLDLPQEWTLFWKASAGTESRQLLAHPTATDWVGTLSLEVGHAQKLMAALATHPA